MTLEFAPYYYGIRLHLAWACFFYWYVVFANGPLTRKKGQTFFQFIEQGVVKKNQPLQLPIWLLRGLTAFYVVGFFFPVTWLLWSWWAIKWATLDIANSTLRYWFPLWLRWSIKGKTPQQVAEWRNNHLAELAKLADPACYCGRPLTEHRVGGAAHQFWPAGMSNQEIERRILATQHP